MFFTPSGPLLLSAVVGGTGYPRPFIDDPPNDPADREPPTLDEQPGAIPDEGTLAPLPPKPGRPGDSANPRKDPNAGDNTDRGPGAKVSKSVIHGWVDHFRKAGATPKIKRDAFLYMAPARSAASGDFAQCSSCVMWVQDYDACTIHGEDVEIEGGDSCGLYVPGKPQPSERRRVN